MKKTRKTGERLRKFRIEKDLNQSQMADIFGITREAYNKIEKGKNNITVPHLRTIYELFSISPNWIILGLPPVDMDFPESEKVFQMIEHMKSNPVILHSILSVFFEIKGLEKEQELTKSINM